VFEDIVSNEPYPKTPAQEEILLRSVSTSTKANEDSVVVEAVGSEKFSLGWLK